MRQPVDRIPEAIMARIEFLLERRNWTVDHLAQRLGVTSTSLRQAMVRKTLTNHMAGIAKAFGLTERILADEKMSNEEVLRRSLIAQKAETKDLEKVTLGRIAFEDTPHSFGRGRFALLERGGDLREGDLAAYWSDDGAGWVVRKVGQVKDPKQVLLFNPHVGTQGEIKTRQWANANLRKVLGIVDMKDGEKIGQ